jgi:hypothetical protein
MHLLALSFWIFLFSPAPLYLSTHGLAKRKIGTDMLHGSTETTGWRLLSPWFFQDLYL